VLFGIVLLLSILLAIPGQSPLILGVEVIVLAASGGLGLFLLGRRARGPRIQQRIGHVLEVVSPNTITTFLPLLSGLLLAFGFDAGLYVMAALVLIALVGGLASAWLFMTRIGEGPASHIGT
jgi:hypothetical protein